MEVELSTGEHSQETTTTTTTTTTTATANCANGIGRCLISTRLLLGKKVLVLMMNIYYNYLPAIESISVGIFGYLS